MEVWQKSEQEMRERLNARYVAEGWGRLAVEAGFDPYDMESSARSAFQHCYDRIAKLEAALRANGLAIPD